MIEELLKNNESKTLEFKENLQSLTNIIKTIIAFSNTAGGIIIIGVEDKTKKIVGLNNPLAEEERLANSISDSIAPLIMPDIEVHSYQNKELIVINVPHVAGPCYIKSAGLEKGTYIRLGSTNRIVDSEMLQALKNFSRNIYFDELPFIQGEETDLDWQFIEDLFKQSHKNITIENAESLGLFVSKGKKRVPSFGGIILFGKNRNKLFPEAIIRCVRFHGSERDTIIDQVDIDTYLPLALKQAIKFIQRNTKLSAEIKELTRIDIPEYPLPAIREAIINAIVHADYAIKGVYISISIFDNRIEFTNPGGLPFGFTIEKILTGSSRIRNRVIAKVFYHLKLIEQWGRGCKLIVNECNKRGLAEPKFEELNNQFRVTIYSISDLTKKQNLTMELVSTQEEKLINSLKKNNQIKTKDAAALWEITPRAARLRLIKLVNNGLIKKNGTSLKDPKGFYVLTNTNLLPQKSSR